MTQGIQKTQQASGVVQYGKYDPSVSQEEQSFFASDLDFLKLSVGDNVVRFLPPPVGWDRPYVLVKQHFIQADGMEKGFSVVCARQMARERCIICEKISEFKAMGNDIQYQLAEKMFARPRAFANVIDRRNPELGPRILAFGKTIFEQLSKIAADNGDYSDPETGFDINITRVGTGQQDTKYFLIPRGPSHLGDLNWITEVTDLSKFAKIDSAEEIMRRCGDLFAPPRVRPIPGRPQQPGRQLPPQAQPQPRQPAQRTVADDMTDTFPKGY